MQNTYALILTSDFLVQSWYCVSEFFAPRFFPEKNEESKEPDVKSWKCFETAWLILNLFRFLPDSIKLSLLVGAFVVIIPGTRTIANLTAVYNPIRRGWKSSSHVLAVFFESKKIAKHIKNNYSLALPQHQHTSFLCPDVSDRIALSFFKELLKFKSSLKKDRAILSETSGQRKLVCWCWGRAKGYHGPARTQRIINNYSFRPCVMHNGDRDGWRRVPPCEAG